MSATKKGFSSKEIQRQLGLKRYEPVWSMVHKIREALSQWDDRYTVEGMIKSDEGYFSIEASAVERSKQESARGSKTKSNMMVIAESMILEDIETGKTDQQCRYFKARVQNDHKSTSTDETLKKYFGEKVMVFSDKSTSYLHIEDYVSIHIAESP